MNQAGQVLRRYRYSAFGVEFDQDPADTNPWRYRGEYFDVETGMVYLRARFMNPRTSRFITADPYWGVHSMQNCVLSMRQAGNLFVYGLNNPLMFIDPLGLAVWFIHGTFSNPDRAWNQEFINWAMGSDGPFTGEEWFRFDWSDTGWFGGGNNKSARQTAANRLFEMILEHHRANPNDPIRLVGHSHGGNVGILVINMLGAEGIVVDTLITIGTPARRDYQLNNFALIGQHLNIYNTIDRTQIAGMGFGAPMDGRRFRGIAENINVTPYIPRGQRGMFSSHSAMHNNTDIWDLRIVPSLR